MRAEEALKIFEDHGAITKGHYVYSSRSHGEVYVRKDRVYVSPIDSSKLAQGLAEHFADMEVEMVIGPAIGGAILAQLIAYHLSIIASYEIIFGYAEKEEEPVPGLPACYRRTGRFIFTRGYDKLISGKKVLIVDDVLTSGATMKRLIDAVRAAEGKVIGVGVLCSRRNEDSPELSRMPKFESLFTVPFPAWREEDCELCKRLVPINTDVGYGKEFLIDHPRYPR